jgi:hypothetical protein
MLYVWGAQGARGSGELRRAAPSAAAALAPGAHAGPPRARALTRLRDHQHAGHALQHLVEDGLRRGGEQLPQQLGALAVHRHILLRLVEQAVGGDARHG